MNHPEPNGRWKLRLTNDVSVADLLTIAVVAVGLIGGYFRLEARVGAQEVLAARYERESDALRAQVERQRNDGSAVLQRLSTIEATLAAQTELLKEMRQDIKNGRGRDSTK